MANPGGEMTWTDEEIDEKLCVLSGREMEVIQWRLRGYNQVETGRMMGISQQAVSKILVVVKNHLSISCKNASKMSGIGSCDD
jgi:DNA-directed RNA polymerase specialized sigma subunit